MQGEEQITGTWTDWATDRILRGIIFALMRLPRATRLRLMGSLMRRIVGPLAGYRKRAETNLAYIWPDMPEAERTRIANAALDHAGRTTIENYDVDGLMSLMKDVPLSGEGVTAVEEAKANGQPILFVTGHFGNHEAPRAALVARGYQVGGLYRPMANPYFNDHYAANMHAMSGPVFEQGAKGTMGLVRHIKRGGMGVLLFDIYVWEAADMNFLGKPAPTATSAADIALRTGALLVPFFGRRTADGLGYEAIFDAPIPHTTPEDMMQEATRRLENQIIQCPEQWFWVHRRWVKN